MRGGVNGSVVNGRTGAALAAVALLAAACQGGGAATNAAPRSATSAEPEASSAEARLSVSPADGASKVRPDVPVVVTTSGGKIGDVVVSTEGVKVEGDLAADGSRWASRWPLTPGTKYQV